MVVDRPVSRTIARGPTSSSTAAVEVVNAATRDQLMSADPVAVESDAQHHCEYEGMGNGEWGMAKGEWGLDLLKCAMCILTPQSLIFSLSRLPLARASVASFYSVA